METTQCANKNKAGNYRAKVVKKVGQEGQDYILEEGRHYLFRDANSFPRAKLMENCELWAAKDIFLVLVLSGQYLFVEAHSFPRALLQEMHIFAPNGGYCLYLIIWNLCITFHCVRCERLLDWCTLTMLTNFLLVKQRISPLCSVFIHLELCISHLADSVIQNLLHQ